MADMNNDRGGGASGRPAKRTKRVVTVARREQNRVAQRIYRQKQRAQSQSLRQAQQASAKKQHELRPRLPLNGGSSEGIHTTTEDITNRPAEHHDRGAASPIPEVQTLEEAKFVAPSLHVHTNEGDEGDQGDHGNDGGLVNRSDAPFSIASIGSNIIGQSSISDGLLCSEAHGPTHVCGMSCFNNPNLAPGALDNAGIDTTSSSLADSLNTSAADNTAANYCTGRYNPFHEQRMTLSLDAFADACTLLGLDQPTSDDLARILRDRSLEAVIWAGLDVVFGGRVQSDPYKNFIQDSGTSTLTACLHNARCLGMRIQDLLPSGCGTALSRPGTVAHSSPFYRPNAMTEDVQSCLTMAYDSSIPAHLQPTLAQIVFQHPAYLDLLPFPAMRARAITLAVTTPDEFDMFELKRDVYTDGIVMSRTKSGQPWDMHSWEISSWFRKKWRVLLEG